MAGKLKTIGSLKMALKQLMARVLPPFIINRIRLQKGIKQLGIVQRQEWKTNSLRHKNDLSLSEIFSSHAIKGIWFDSEKEIKQFNIPDAASGGVNPGDRRAIYYLISAIKPISVLEIGTHIGSSTIHIASALRNHSDKNVNLTTVDIADVNSRIEKPWVQYGTTHSPSEMIDKLGYAFVEFVTDTSLNYAANCQRRFDFIFLDGDHSAKTVCQEISVALNLLNQNGVILLHDYFPDMKPLWSNGAVIPGPFLAT